MLGGGINLYKIMKVILLIKIAEYYIIREDYILLPFNLTDNLNESWVVKLIIYLFLEADSLLL